MSSFFLIPSSLSDLSLLIFIGSVLSYLFFLWRQMRRQGEELVVLALLIGVIGAIGTFVALTFLEHTLYPDAGQLALPMQAVFLTLGLVCMLQFIYRFPAMFPPEQREARIALWISLILPAWELAFALYRYAMLARGEIHYRPDWPLVPLIVWILFVLLRKVSLADDRPIPYWRKLWSPADRMARTARHFALLGLAPVVLLGISLPAWGGPHPRIGAPALMSAGLLVSLLLFILSYVNFLPQQTSFLVKFLAVSLAFLLALTGALGHIMTPAFVAAYHDPDTDLAGKAFSFVPNQVEGYTVTQIPLEIGPIGEISLPDEHNPVEIGFAFPFYDTVWTDAFVMRDLYVTFGRSVGRIDSLYQYGGAPGIFALHTDLIPPPEGEAGGLFIHRTSAQFTATWLDLPQSSYPDTLRTAQVILYPDGSFTINFIDPGLVKPMDIVTPWRSFRLIGALSGDGNRRVDDLRLDQDLPFVGDANGAAVLYHLRFRQTLHDFLLPILRLMVVSALILAVSVPIYFRPTLSEPLARLLRGIKEFERGNYTVDIPVRVHDEFGALAGAFNTLSSELDGLIRDLEGRVTERTARFTETSAYLDNILRSATDYAIVTTDRQMQITYFNSLAEELYGIQEGDALGQPISQIAGPSLNMDRFRQGMQQVTSQGTHEYVMEHDTPGGSRYILSRISSIQDSEGNTIGYARFSRDITEQRTTEARLLGQQRAIAALEERSQIGRELHDRLGQIFGFLSLQSQTAEALIIAGKRESGLIALERLGEVAQDAHNQVREFILGMRERPLATKICGRVCRPCQSSTPPLRF